MGRGVAEKRKDICRNPNPARVPEEGEGMMKNM